MTSREQELVQAWIDGQLGPTEAREVAALVQRDPAFRALADNVRGLSRLLRDHPLPRTVPESREFYWSKIRRGIEENERAVERTRDQGSLATRALRWLPWLVPAAAAVLAVAFFLRPAPETPTLVGPRGVPQMAEHRVEAVSDQLTTLTFYSAEDAMTVVWLGQVDLM